MHTMNVQRAVSPGALRPGDFPSVTLTIETDSAVGRMAIQDTVLGDVDAIDVHGVSIDGEPVEPMLSDVFGESPTVVLTDVEADSTIDVRYVVTPAEDSGPNSGITFDSGRCVTSSDGTADVDKDFVDFVYAHDNPGIEPVSVREMRDGTPVEIRLSEPQYWNWVTNGELSDSTTPILMAMLYNGGDTYDWHVGDSYRFGMPGDEVVVFNDARAEFSHDELVVRVYFENPA